jgi:hypothetical protein
VTRTAGCDNGSRHFSQNFDSAADCCVPHFTQKRGELDD